MARKYSNTSVETTLVNSVNASQTSIEINDTGGLPATFPYSLVLDFEAANVEVVTVTNLAGSTLTVTRGQDGTAAQSHNAGAVVVHGVTARDLSEPQEHIDATSEVHGLDPGSALAGTTDTQVLTNKTITFTDNTLTGVASTSTAQTLTGKTIAFDDNTLTDVASVDTAQVLINKTVTFVDNTLTGVASTSTAQTLTNKTIDAASNTLSNINGASLVTPFDGSAVDATFNSVTLSGPTPDVNVATDLASLRTDVTTLDSTILRSFKDVESVSFTSESSVVILVNFGQTLPEAPNVHCNINVSPAATSGWHVRAINITTTKFDLHLFGPTNTFASIPVAWTAFYSDTL